jgi:hypothetical protein
MLVGVDVLYPLRRPGPSTNALLGARFWYPSAVDSTETERAPLSVREARSFES